MGMVDTFKSYKWSKSILERADDALEFPVSNTQLSKLMQEGPAEQLNSTENSQPAIMVSSIVTKTLVILVVSKTHTRLI